MKYLLLTALFAIGSTHAMQTVNKDLPEQTTNRIVEQSKAIGQRDQQPLGLGLAERDPRTVNWLAGVGARGWLLNRKKDDKK